MEDFMNLGIKSVIAIVALSASVFAADPVIPAAEPAPAAEATAAPAAEPAVESVAAPAAETPVAEAAAPAAEAPATEAAAETAAAPAADVAPAPAAEPAPEATEDVAAPMAVRGADASAPVAAKAEPVAAPAPTQAQETKFVYQTVPVKTVYVAQSSSGDTISFEELRGLVPMKLRFGVQAMIGSYGIMSTDPYYNDFEDYSGLTWRAGAFSIIPLNDYTVGFRVGAIYEQSEASTSSSRYGMSAKFKQSKVDIPMLFVFKAPRSSFMFEVGAQAAIPVKDEFKVSSSAGKYKLDMLDKDYRKSVDWDIVFGFSVMANKYVGLDLSFDLGLSNMYDSAIDDNLKYFNLDDLSSSAFQVGISFYLF